MAEENTPQKDLSQLSFEDALRALESIVRRLESGDVPLDESISLYAQGEELRKRCTERLQAAEARISKLTVDAGGATRGLTGRQGLPWHTMAGGRLRNTELRAPTTASRPTVTPGPTNTSVATQAPSSMRTARSRRGKSD